MKLGQVLNIVIEKVFYETFIGNIFQDLEEWVLNPGPF